jgi:hypothetical protein
VRADTDDARNSQTGLSKNTTRSTGDPMQHDHFGLNMPSFCGILSSATLVLKFRWSMTVVNFRWPRTAASLLSVRADSDDACDFQAELSKNTTYCINGPTEHDHFGLKTHSLCGVLFPACSVITIRWSTTPPLLPNFACRYATCSAGRLP